MTCHETGGAGEGRDSRQSRPPGVDEASGGAVPSDGSPDGGLSERGFLRRMFCRCAGPAAGGVLLSHAACLAVPVLAGLSGVATGAFLHAAMFAASPVIAAGVVLGFACWRGENPAARPVLSRAGLSATIALAVTFGISALGGGHEGHHGHDHGSHGGDPAAAASWFEALPEKDRRQIEDIAERADIAVQDYVRELRGVPALSDEEKDRLRESVGQTCPCQLPGACKIEGLTP